jgi:predicted dehydrogenase
MAKKLGYGLIGCGGCGEHKHLAAYKRYPDEIELVAVYDADRAKAEAVAARHRIPTVCGSYQELLANPAIAIVSVVTPNVTHAPLAIAALRAGKHVHLEKPIAMNAGEARAIVAAKNRARRKLLVALNNRFTETSRYAKRYVDEGHLGEIYHARCGWRRRAGCNIFGTWFANKQMSGGGPLIDLGVHFFDLTLHLLGFPAPVSVSGACYDKLANPRRPFRSVMLGRDKARGKYDVEDLAVGFVRLATGCSVAFEFSWGSHVERETNYLELLGVRGGLRLQDGVLKIFTETAGGLADLVPQVQNTGGWGENETRHFIDCIRNGREPLAPPEQAVQMMRIVDAIYASSQAGREIRLQ